MGEIAHCCGSCETHIIFCPSKSGGIENYVLIPVEGEGFIAIKQEIAVDAGNEEVKKRNTQQEWVPMGKLPLLLF